MPMKLIYKLLHNLSELLSSSQDMKLVRILYLQEDTNITLAVPWLHHRLILITGFVFSYLEIQDSTGYIMYIKVCSIYKSI
jgi:hypothetical protein